MNLASAFSNFFFDVAFFPLLLIPISEILHGDTNLQQRFFLKPISSNAINPRIGREGTSFWKSWAVCSADVASIRSRADAGVAINRSRADAYVATNRSRADADVDTNQSRADATVTICCRLLDASRFRGIVSAHIAVRIQLFVLVLELLDANSIPISCSYHSLRILVDIKEKNFSARYSCTSNSSVKKTMPIFFSYIKYIKVVISGKYKNLNKITKN